MNFVFITPAINNTAEVQSKNIVNSVEQQWQVDSRSKKSQYRIVIRS